MSVVGRYWKQIDCAYLNFYRPRIGLGVVVWVLVGFKKVWININCGGNFFHRQKWSIWWGLSWNFRCRFGRVVVVEAVKVRRSQRSGRKDNPWKLENSLFEPRGTPIKFKSAEPIASALKIDFNGLWAFSCNFGNIGPVWSLLNRRRGWRWNMAMLAAA